jgi:DHA2 family methylenomycin A resistance protein-like MFS transporter
MTTRSQSTDRSANRKPLAAICTGYFMVILDTTVVNVALPSLGRGLHAGTAGLQWAVDGYTLILAGFLLSAGALGDRLGAKAMFQAGMALFVVASAGCGLAPDIIVLVVARLVQGLGAAMTVPASLSLLQAAYPERGARAKAFGVWGGVAGIAAGAGPIVGGLLVAGYGWRAVFFVNVPIGVAGLFLTARYVPAPARHTQRLDLPAQAVGVLALAALTAALIEAGSQGFATPVVLGAFALFAAACGTFVALERRGRAPMLPLGWFRDPTFSAASAVGLLINLGFYGQLFVATLYFQQIRGYSALLTGLALLPQMGMAAIASPLSGRVMARTGPRRPMIAGLALGGAGLLGLLVADARTPYGLLVAPLMAVGFGMAFTMPAATAAVMGAAPDGRGGMASGVINAARQVGGVIGIALLGALVAHRATFISGLHAAVIIGGAAFLLGCGLTIAAVGRGRQHPGRRHRSAASVRGRGTTGCPAAAEASTGQPLCVGGRLVSGREKPSAGRCRCRHR